MALYQLLQLLIRETVPFQKLHQNSSMSNFEQMHSHHSMLLKTQHMGSL